MTEFRKIDCEVAWDGYLADLDDGWKPVEIAALECECHISPPCGYCHFEADEYFEEWLEENMFIIEE